LFGSTSADESKAENPIVVTGCVDKRVSQSEDICISRTISIGAKLQHNIRHSDNRSIQRDVYINNDDFGFFL
jgi:hypothetical protein